MSQGNTLNWAEFDWKAANVNEENQQSAYQQIGAHLFTDYKAIVASFNQATVFYGSGKLDDLITFARYLEELDDVREAVERKDDAIPEVKADPEKILRIMLENPALFTTAKIVDLVMKHEHIFDTWLHYASKEQVESVMFYNYAVEEKLVTGFREAAELNRRRQTDAEANLEFSVRNLVVWNAFSDGRITDKLMRSRYVHGLDRGAMRDAVRLAYNATQARGSMEASIQSYKNWVNSYRMWDGWYGPLGSFTIIWSYLRWIASYTNLVDVGDIYDSSLSYDLDLTAMQSERNMVELAYVSQQNALYQGQLQEVGAALSQLQSRIEDLDADNLQASVAEMKASVESVNAALGALPTGKKSKRVDGATYQEIIGMFKQAGAVVAKQDARIAHIERDMTTLHDKVDTVADGMKLASGQVKPADVPHLMDAWKRYTRARQPQEREFERARTQPQRLHEVHQTGGSSYGISSPVKGGGNRY